MSGGRVFVGNVPWSLDKAAFQELFEHVGQISDAQVLRTPEGKPRGFGFITFENEADADRAISDMNGKMVESRVLRVEKAERASGKSGGTRTRSPDHSRNHSPARRSDSPSKTRNFESGSSHAREGRDSRDVRDSHFHDSRDYRDVRDGRESRDRSRQYSPSGSRRSGHDYPLPSHPTERGVLESYFSSSSSSRRSPPRPSSPPRDDRRRYPSDSTSAYRRPSPSTSRPSSSAPIPSREDLLRAREYPSYPSTAPSDSYRHRSDVAPVPHPPSPPSSRRRPAEHDAREYDDWDSRKRARNHSPLPIAPAPLPDSRSGYREPERAAYREPDLRDRQVSSASGYGDRHRDSGSYAYGDSRSATAPVSSSRSAYPSDYSRDSYSSSHPHTSSYRSASPSRALAEPSSRRDSEFRGKR